MNIKDVQTAIKNDDFIIKINNKNKIDIRYLASLDKKMLTDNSARIYLMVQNGIIEKIGGSTSKGGIKATMNPYISAMTGSPGVPRFVVHLLIEKVLKNKSKVELFMITSPKTLARVPGLFGYKKVRIASFKEMENLCKSDYYLKEKYRAREKEACLTALLIASCPCQQLYHLFYKLLRPEIHPARPG